jgi:hypothetical protein
VRRRPRRKKKGRVGREEGGEGRKRKRKRKGSGVEWSGVEAEGREAREEERLGRKRG